jgi:ribosomal protein S12 methylthiotransferase
VGCFQYSAVEGAAANAVAAPVHEEVKQARYERFMERAGVISAARLRERIGSRCRVLVDSVEGGVAIARSAAEAPEIDGVIRIPRAAGLAIGEFTDVTITAADTYDLEAAILTAPAAR